MLKMYLLLTNDTWNINFYDSLCCFSIALPLFIHTNLVNVNTNIGILIFLNMTPLQYLVFAPGAQIRINTVYLIYIFPQGFY